MMRTLAALVFAWPALAAPDYRRDVEPALATCLSCHGPDQQKGSLRLDRRAGVLSVVTPGKSANSELIRRITTHEADVRMPPKGPALAVEKVRLIREWIDAGAKYPAEADGTWWSLAALKRPTVPTDAKHPIDAFVRAKLREQGLSGSPQADRRTLIRRVTFDLIGLPPTPEEIEAFANDKSHNAWEKVVDRLLDSPQFGERWARHWLDVVHYGDTHGYDKDKPRPNAWPYRDYVIRSLNTDKPYGKFIREQIAGDVLFPGTTDGIEALGFIAAGPWDFIGHAEVPESKIDGKIARHLDRDDMVANTIGTFQSLTVHCAQCHNHKFDPIPQEDYYRLQAVFAAVDRTDFAYDNDPGIAQKRREITARLGDLTKQRAAIDARIKQLGGKELAEIEARLAKGSTKAAPAEFGYHSAIEPTADRVKWVQVDLGKTIDISEVAVIGAHDPFNNIGAGFGFPVRFKIETSDDPTFAKNVIIVADQTTTDHSNPGTSPQRFKATNAKGRYVRLTATKLALRQNDYILAIAELEVLDASGKNVARNQPVSSLDSIEAAPRWRRSNLTDGLTHPSAQSDVNPIALRQERETLLARVVPADVRGELARLDRFIATERQQLTRLPAQRTAYIGAVHHGSGTFSGTGGNGGKPRPIFVLPRGDVTKPGKEVTPGALSGLSVLPGEFRLPANHGEGDRRAALANWIASRDNPLTWRSIVNRLWLYHFGRGMVDTPNDFGRMGQSPTHPELLDWLAVEMRDGGESMKRIHRLIVTSETYQQASTAAIDHPAMKVDGQNSLYWRMNRRKLEAEAVRDSVLAVSGKLDRTPFGPGFQDFVVEKPEHSPHYQYHLHDVEDVRSHRRSIYRFIVRSNVHPFLSTLDCADPSLAVEKRTQTISPLQALALLNNRLCVAMAKHFAARLESGAQTVPEQIALGYRLALGRSPSTEESRELEGYARKHGLASACRVILNLNEFVFVD